MNTKVIIALFCALAIATAAGTPGNNAIACTTNCDDTGCGKAGSGTNNWKAAAAGAPQCVVTDCSLLTTGNTANACKSCAATGVDAFPNTAGTACVAVNCATKATDKTYTDADCVTCNATGYTAATDKASCVAPSSNGKVLAASAAIIAALLF